jgi:hypothetical protein
MASTRCGMTIFITARLSRSPAAKKHTIRITSARPRSSYRPQSGATSSRASATAGRSSGAALRPWISIPRLSSISSRTTTR